MKTIYIDKCDWPVYVVDREPGPFIKTQYLTHLTDEQLERFNKVFAEFNAVQDELEALDRENHRDVKP